MSTLLPLSGSLDDIVFEGRNQAYGAFQLRRSYQRHLGSALAIALVACTVLFLLPLAVRHFWPDAAVNTPTDVPIDGTYQPGHYVLPQPNPVLPPTLAAVHPAVVVTPHSTIQTLVVPDPEVKPIVDSDLPQGVGPAGPAKAGAENPTGTSAGTGSGVAAGTGVDTARPMVAPAPEVVLTAEVMPEFVGGRAALQRYLQRHLRFPGAALAAQASGRVYVSFVVQTDGSIGEVTVLKGLGYGTEEAAARVVREMPAWTPGMQNHHAVAVRFTLPITFQFE